MGISCRPPAVPSPSCHRAGCTGLLSQSLFITSPPASRTLCPEASGLGPSLSLCGQVTHCPLGGPHAPWHLEASLTPRYLLMPSQQHEAWGGAGTLMSVCPTGCVMPSSIFLLPDLRGSAFCLWAPLLGWRRLAPVTWNRPAFDDFLRVNHRLCPLDLPRKETIHRKPAPRSPGACGEGASRTWWDRLHPRKATG